MCVDDVLRVIKERDAGAAGRFNALDPGDKKWGATRKEAVAYFKKHGYWPGTNDGGVGRWVSSQRNQSVRGSTSRSVASTC
jgi:hypothetical protein